MFKQLKYFQSVVRLNSFSEAAEGNYISQSAISQQIQALERELGFKLFERRNRSFTPTPAGEYFYRKSLVLTADHGGHDRGHGEDIPEDRTIPIVFAGAPFASGRALEAMTIKDIAPTVLQVLGLPKPMAWEGRSIL